MLDLATGTSTRDIRTFAAATLGGSPEGLALRTRVSFADRLLSDDPEEMAEDRAIAERGARHAGVPLPTFVQEAASLETCYTLRARVGPRRATEGYFVSAAPLVGAGS